MCDSVYSKEVSLLCSVKFSALALFCYWKKKKNDTKKLDPDASAVSNNNESEVPT